MRLTESSQPTMRQDEDEDGGLGQTLLVGGLILVFLIALAGLLYLTLLN